MKLYDLCDWHQNEGSYNHYIFSTYEKAKAYKDIQESSEYHTWDIYVIEVDNPDFAETPKEER
jgi:hypothetical protein